jgi:hypothetical protein
VRNCVVSLLHGWRRCWKWAKPGCVSRDLLRSRRDVGSRDCLPLISQFAVVGGMLEGADVELRLSNFTSLVRRRCWKGGGGLMWVRQSVCKNRRDVGGGG